MAGEKKNPRNGREESDGGFGGVADYLSAPKKKLKSYIVMSLASNVSEDHKADLLKYLSTLSKVFVLAQPKDPDELARQISRQVHLMILDDSFAPRDRLLKLVKFMKEKKGSESLPVLFLTREPKAMTTSYRDILVAHQENDDYMDLNGQNSVELVARIKQALEFRNRRRSRRFKVNLPVSFQVLGTDEWQKGTLLDLSLHGAMLSANEPKVAFDLKSQVRIQIPVGDVFVPAEGEIFRLSARVRRLSITAVGAGLSFEHVTERQVTLLTTFVTALASAQSLDRDLNNSTGLLD